LLFFVGYFSLSLGLPKPLSFGKVYIVNQGMGELILDKKLIIF